MVIRREREVDEDSPLGGNSHSSHLLRGKGGHFFQPNLFRADCGCLQKHDRAGGSSQITKSITRTSVFGNCMDAPVIFVLEADSSHKSFNFRRENRRILRDAETTFTKASRR